MVDASDLPLSAAPPPADPADRPQYDAVLDLARRCHYEAGHTHQVTRLALQLFDALAPLHGLGPRERFLLQAGAMLHDIGWLLGRAGHHKAAARLIMDDPDLGLDDRRRRIVALIARYHRKALPKMGHADYAALAGDDRRTVRQLAALVRVADGLDRSHTSCVRSLTCTISEDRIEIALEAHGPAEAEIAATLEKKADLFQRAYGRKLFVRTAG